MRLALLLVLQLPQILLEFLLHLRDFVHLVAADLEGVVGVGHLRPLTLHPKYRLPLTLLRSHRVILEHSGLVCSVDGGLPGQAFVFVGCAFLALKLMHHLLLLLRLLPGLS